MHSEIEKTAAKKPVVTSMASVAASGGYYIAVASPRIFANPGTITGSIGVIMELANLEKLYEWAKVQRFSIKTGKFKDAGAEYRKMEPEERKLLQDMIDTTLVDFKAAVAKGRKLELRKWTPLQMVESFRGLKPSKPNWWMTWEAFKMRSMQPPRWPNSKVSPESCIRKSPSVEDCCAFCLIVSETAIARTTTRPDLTSGRWAGLLA
jgi:hypothetical protein